jgi:TolA-binding protein
MSAQAIYDQGFKDRCDGKYDEAKAAFKQVLAIEPSHSDAKWQLGLVQGFEGDFEGSLETLAGVVVSQPSHVNARCDLAMTMMMLGMTQEACAQFKEVLRLDPTNEKANQQIVYC